MGFSHYHKSQNCIDRSPLQHRRPSPSLGKLAETNLAWQSHRSLLERPAAAICQLQECTRQCRRRSRYLVEVRLERFLFLGLGLYMVRLGRFPWFTLLPKKPCAASMRTAVSGWCSLTCLFWSRVLVGCRLLHSVHFVLSDSADKWRDYVKVCRINDGLVCHAHVESIYGILWYRILWAGP